MHKLSSTATYLLYKSRPVFFEEKKIRNKKRIIYFKIFDFMNAPPSFTLFWLNLVESSAYVAPCFHSVKQTLQIINVPAKSQIFTDFSFSNVRINCFSLSYMTENWICLSFGLYLENTRLGNHNRYFSQFSCYWQNN